MTVLKMAVRISSTVRNQAAGVGIPAAAPYGSVDDVEPLSMAIVLFDVADSGPGTASGGEKEIS